MDINSIVQPKKNPKVPDFRPGDTVRVMARVVEGDRERTQAFEGVVIRKRRGGVNSNFTVRRVAHGIGVERTFPLYSPRLESVQVVRVGKVRRARLYYLRERIGKRARIRAGSRDRFEELTRQFAEGEQALEAEMAAGEAEMAETVEGEEESPAEGEAQPEAEGGEEPAAGAEAAVEAGTEQEPAAEEATEEEAPESEPATEEEKAG